MRGAAFFLAAAGFFPEAAATEARSASIRSTTGVGAGSAPASRSRAPRASPRAARAALAVLALQLVRIERRRERRDDLLRELELRLLDLGAGDRLVDLGVVLHVLVDEERLERERVAHRADQAELLLARRGRSGRARRRPPPSSPRAAARTAAARLGARGHEVVRAVEVDRVDVARAGRSGRSRSSGDVSCCSIASSSASSTMTNWPFATSQPRTSSSDSTSRSCTGHQRFCLIGVPHSRCSIRNDTSDWRAAGFVAGASPTGMFTRPKLIDAVPGCPHVHPECVRVDSPNSRSPRDVPAAIVLTRRG